MSIRSTDIIFLLGAGASVEAGIPASAPMIAQIEELLASHQDWNPYRELYHHVKSAIHFAAGIRGVFNNSVTYNIETLVNTLYELERNEEHPLYPFIASWNSRFVALAGTGFDNVRKFRRLILAQLKKWMCPEDTSKGGYYRGFVRLQKDLNFPLSIFSLNYDLLVEDLGDRDFRVETGFADSGPQHSWNFERFEDGGPGPAPQAYLYKLHGSINWKREQTTKQLYSVKQVEMVEYDRMEVIFGRDFKLEAADPYLFYAYAFRQAALRAKLIVIIGYGFADSHINKMLTQGLRGDNAPVLCVVSRCAEGELDSNARKLARQLELAETQFTQVKYLKGTAKEFLETSDLAKLLQTQIPPGTDAPF